MVSIKTEQDTAIEIKVEVPEPTWVYQKVPRLSSTDRKQMALGEYLRYG